MKGSTGPQPLRCNPRKKDSQQDINRAAARAGPRQGGTPKLTTWPITYAYSDFAKSSRRSLFFWRSPRDNVPPEGCAAIGFRFVLIIALVRAGVPGAVIRSWRVPDCLGGVGVSLLPDTG
jgi:hypothetical protein